MSSSRYVKTIVAVLGGVSTWGITAASDNAITQVELFGLLGVLSTVLGVYALPNTPPAGEPADPNISERDHPASPSFVTAAPAEPAAKKKAPAKKKAAKKR